MNKERVYEERLESQMQKIANLEKMSDDMRVQKEQEMDKFKQQFTHIEDTYKKQLQEVKQALIDSKQERQKETEMLEQKIRRKSTGGTLKSESLKADSLRVEGHAKAEGKTDKDAKEHTSEDSPKPQTPT